MVVGVVPVAKLSKMSTQGRVDVDREAGERKRRESKRRGNSVDKLGAG